MSTSPSETAPAPVAAAYFDGRSARAHAVTIALHDGVLQLHGEGVARSDPVARLHVSEPMGRAPRLIEYPDGAHCEVRDHAGFSALLAASGHGDGWVVRAQSRWGWMAASMLVAALVLVAGYRWAVPMAAAWIATTLPQKAVSQVGRGTLELLDRGLLRPSKLASERKKALADAFERLVTRDAQRARYRLQFRDGGRLDANALALPDGTIVLTDQLVGLAQRDEEILAVLAHELGHVRHRHGLRLLIQGSLVAFVVSWYLGDFSSLAVAAPTVLLQARYSREHELEADRYAAAMLGANGISAEALVTMLLALETARRRESSEDDSGARKSAPQRPDLGDYLASHPATQERIEALRRR